MRKFKGCIGTLLIVGDHNSDLNNASIENLSKEEAVAENNAIFLGSLEKWLLALLQSNYAKSDEEIIKKVLDSCKTALASNIAYHDLMSNEMEGSEPVIARQHRLLSKIYTELANNQKL